MHPFAALIVFVRNSVFSIVAKRLIIDHQRTQTQAKHPNRSLHASSLMIQCEEVIGGVNPTSAHKGRNLGPF